MQNTNGSRSFVVQNASGVSLSGIMDLTSNAGAPVFVLVHGFRDSKNGRFVTKVAQELTSRGKKTVRFDCTGNEESGGEFTYSNYSGEAEDLRAVGAYIRAQGERVDAIVGHSKGAGVVLMYAQKYGDVPLVAALAPRFHMSTGVVERFGQDVIDTVRETGSALNTAKDGFTYTLSKEALDDRLSIDMGEVGKGIRNGIHVVVVHGSDHKVIPVSHADEFEGCILNCKKVIIEGAGHGFRGKEGKVVDAFVAAEGE